MNKRKRAAIIYLALFLIFLLAFAAFSRDLVTRTPFGARDSGAGKQEKVERFQRRHSGLGMLDGVAWHTYEPAGVAQRRLVRPSGRYIEEANRRHPAVARRGGNGLSGALSAPARPEYPGLYYPSLASSAPIYDFPPINPVSPVYPVNPVVPVYPVVPVVPVYPVSPVVPVNPVTPGPDYPPEPPSPPYKPGSDAVPIPSAVWMLGVGLAALTGMRWRSHMQKRQADLAA